MRLSDPLVEGACLDADMGDVRGGTSILSIAAGEEHRGTTLLCLTVKGLELI